MIAIVTAEHDHPAMLLAASRRRAARRRFAAVSFATLIAAAWAAWPLRTHATRPAPIAVMRATGADPAFSPAPPYLALSTIWPDPAEVENPPIRLVAVLPGMSSSAWVTRIADGSTLQVSQGSEIDGWRVITVSSRGIQIQSPKNARLDLTLGEQAPRRDDVGSGEVRQVWSNK